MAMKLTESTPPTGTKPTKKKRRRSHAPSAYNLFVKAHYDSVRSIKTPQDRMKELGRLWRKHKEAGKSKKSKESKESASIPDSKK